MKLSRKIDKGWTLDKGISSSFLGSWLACREKARLDYVELLTPMQGRRESMALGSFIHRCLELAGINNTKAKIEALIQETLAEWQDAEGPRASEKALQQMEDVAGKAEVILPLYFDFWKEKDKSKTWIEREMTFKAQYKGFTLIGQIDGVFRNAKDEIWLMENKTRSRVDGDALSRALVFDLQSNFYQLAALQFISRKNREKFRGTVYNVIRTPQIRVRKKESKYQFYKRMESEILKKPSEYFLRYENSTSVEAIEKWGETVLMPILEQISNWGELAPDYLAGNFLNPQACYDRFGVCKFFRLCVHGEASAYKKKKQAFDHYSSEPVQFFDV